MTSPKFKLRNYHLFWVSELRLDGSHLYTLSCCSDPFKIDYSYFDRKLMFFIISFLCISIYIGFRVRNFSCLHDLFPVSQALLARNFFLKFHNSSRDLLSFLKKWQTVGRGPYSFSLRVVSRACKPVMTYLPSYNLGCPDKSAELYKRMVKTLCAIWTFLLAFYFRYSFSEKVLTKLSSTTGYRPRLNTVY